MPPGCASERGFTLTELITVIVLVGILSVVVLPRFDVFRGMDAAGFADQVQSLFRYAQKTAIAQRRNVSISYSTAAASLCSYTGSVTPCSANCAGATNVTAIALPGGRFRASTTATMTGGTLCFDATGRPFLPGGALTAPLSLTVGDGSETLRTLVVEAETGYVH